MAAVLADAADGLGDPHRVAAEQLVVLRGAQVARHAQMQHEIVHDLLRLALGHQTGLNVALEVNVEEGRGAAEAHRRAVLLLDAGKIAEVQPLNGLLRVLSRTGDVEAVGRRHRDHVLQRLDLVGKLLCTADLLLGGGYFAEGILVLLLLLDQTVYAVQRNAAVVADDAAAAVGVRQTGQQTDMTRLADVLGVRREYAVIVGLVILELLLDLRGDLVAVLFAGVAHHTHAAERVACTLQRLVSLETDDDLAVFVEVAGAERGDSDDGFGVDVADAALFALLGEQGIELLAQSGRACGSRREESAVAVIRGVVLLDKVADVDPGLPVAAIEVVPCVHCNIPPICGRCPFYSAPKRATKKGQHRVKNNHDTAQTVGMKTGTGAPVSDTELPAPRWFALHLVRQLQEICLPLC